MNALIEKNKYFRMYKKYFHQDSNKVINLLLAFMNEIQAIYHFESLGRKIDFTIVHMELMTSKVFSDFGGEREKLLNSFCKYQVTLLVLIFFILNFLRIF
jgi:hypothetical protein